MKIKKLNEHQIFGICAAVLAIFIWLGFGSAEYRIDSCYSTVSKYVTAEYSETTFGTDSEGMPTTDTSFWSEPASEVYSENALNEIVSYPPMPPHYKSMSSDYDFDNFEFHTDTNLSIRASNVEETTRFNEGVSKAAGCINNINTTVVVKTWWTITYGTDFDFGIQNPNN